MSGYQGIKLAANGTSAPLVVTRPQQGPTYNLDVAQASFMLGLIVTLSPDGNLTYTVQVTADPTPSPNGNWANHDVLALMTTGKISNVDYPITGLRLVVTNYVSGSVNLGVALWP